MDGIHRSTDMPSFESDADEFGVEVDEFEALRDQLSRIAGRLSNLATVPSQGGVITPDDIDAVREFVEEATDRLERVRSLVIPEENDGPSCLPDRVLIIDDEENFCLALRRRLQDAGFKAFYETDPGRGPGTVLRRRPGIAFVDICMPEVDGTALAGALKNLVPDLCVVLMTGHFTRQRVFESGTVGDYVVDKDLGIDVLVKIATGHRPARRVLTRKEHLST